MTASGAPIRILVVEDSRTQALRVAQILEDAGFHVQIATDGHDALRQARDAPPALILSDVLMPGMDGFTLCREIRRDRRLAEVPVVLYTATFQNPRDAAFALAVGATRYLLKPRDVAEVVAQVHELLSAGSSQREQPGDPLLGDAAFADEYRERLLATLDQEIAQLAAANQQLAESVAERELLAAQAQRERDFSDAILNTVGALIIVLDPEGRIVRFNRACEQISGYTSEEMVGRFFWEFLLAPDEVVTVRASFDDLCAGYFPNTHENAWIARGGERRLIAWSSTALVDAGGSVEYVIGTGMDMTEHRAVEEQLRRLALHDTLTELPNRTLFTESLELTFARSQRHHELFAVLFLDLDRFKVVNDSLGHAAGDQLLVAVAERLVASLRATDTVARLGHEPGFFPMVARLGGDEFAILLERIRSPYDAARVADRILSQFQTPFMITEQEIFVSASIGIAASHGDYQQAGDLVRDADIAMYRAKHKGRACYEIFDPSMMTRAIERLDLETRLRHALDRGEFRVHYQPEIRLATGALIGVEALVRWEQQEGGLVSPATFIPLAEETGLIVPVGTWVLEEACRQAQVWQKRYPMEPPLQVAVNLSARQFQHPDLVREIARVLQQTGLAPGTLILEITESVAIEDDETTSAMMEQLRALGVQLAIDDFGTGYSSLAYLKQWAVDWLKIDRRFIHGGESGVVDSEIVQAAIQLAHALGLRVVAEGVEHAEQAMRLRELGCDVGQGYYFGRPVPPDALNTFLANHYRRDIHGSLGANR